MLNTRFSRLVDKIQFGGLLAATVLIPLIFNIQNQNIVLLKPLLAQLIMFTLFGLWIIDSLERESFRIPATPLNRPIVLYLLWTVLTVILASPFWFFSIEELGRYLAVFILFFLIQKVVRTTARLKLSLWVLIAVSIVATLYGILQWTGYQFIPWGRPVLISTFGNKNFFAGFLVLLIPTTLGFLLATRNWALRVILLIHLTVMFIMMMQTGTRTGFLGMLAGISIFAFLYFWLTFKSLSSRMKWIQIGLILLVVLVAILIAYYFSTGRLYERLIQAADLQRGTGRVRWIMWTGSSRAALDLPLTGHGHGVFQLVFPNYRPSFYHRFRVSHNTRHSHNEYMEVLMENGIVGLALFLMIFIQMGSSVFRFLNRTRSRFHQYLVMGTTSAIAGSLAQNFASVNLRWMSTTYSFWFIAGITMASIRLASGKPVEQPSSDRRISKSLRWLPPLSWKTPVYGLVLLVLVGVTYNFINIYRADRYLKRMNGLIRQAERNDRFWSMAQRAGETSVSLNPYNLSSKYKLGYVYLSQGKYDQARNMYFSLTDLAPNYAQVHNNIAIVFRYFQQPYREVLHFEWATNLEDNVRNHMNLIRQYLGQNQYGEKIQIPERAGEHMLYVPRLLREDDLDMVHRMVGELEERDFNDIQGKNRSRRRFRGEYERLLRIAPDTLRAPSSRLFSLWEGLHLSLPMSFKQLDARTTPPEPLVLLGYVRRLRGRDGRMGQAIRQRLSEKARDWYSGKQMKPVTRLALADLFAQMGMKRRARMLIQKPPAVWDQFHVLSESLSFVKEKIS